MINRCLILACVLSFHTLAIGQGGVTNDILVWFQTEQLNEESNQGRWVDRSGNDIDLLYRDAQGDEQSDYIGPVYSMNYHPALYFNPDNESYYFNLRSSLNTNSTVMAVLIPRERYTAQQEEWSMRWDYGGGVQRILTVDEVLEPRAPILHQLLNYGEGAGTDLYVKNGERDSYEDEKYGKIVTYNSYLTGDRCTAANSLLAKAFSLYSNNQDDIELAGRQHGQIAEFIVFKKVLTPAERRLFETYLAIKYGISKELDYVGQSNNPAWNGLEMAKFTHRHTGLMAIHEYGLYQSRSNSYYNETGTSFDELADGRFADYTNVHNYSQHPNRLLTISTEDESVPINGGSLVWGDDDGNEKIVAWTDGHFEYQRLIRNWGITKLTGGGSASPSWCNFINMERNANSHFSRRDPNHGTGVMASSTRMNTPSKFEWRTQQKNTSNAVDIIGIAGNQSDFDNPTQFLVACIFVDGKYRIVADEDGDGEYEDNGPDLSYSSTSKFTIELDRDPITNNLIAIVKRGITIFGEYHFNFSCWGSDEYYSKVIFNSDLITIREVAGTGFENPLPDGSNVELSYSLMAEQNPDIEDLTPYLIIDRVGDCNYEENSTDFIKGEYSKTPGGLFNKIEFYSVDWDTDEGAVLPNSDAFTFGFRNCDIEPTVTIDVIECCGDILDLCFTLNDCPENSPMEYAIKLIKENEQILVRSGEYLIDKEHCIGGPPLVPGDYLLCLELRCGTLEEPFTVEPIDLTDIIPESTISMNGASSINIDVTPYIPPWLLDLGELAFSWCNESGTEIQTGPILTGVTEGVYILKVTWICANGNSCLFQDIIEVIQASMCQIQITQFEVDLNDCSRILFAYTGAVNESVLINFEVPKTNIYDCTNATDWELFYPVGGWSTFSNGTGGGHFVIPTEHEDKCLRITVIDENIPTCIDMETAPTDGCCEDCTITIGVEDPDTGSQEVLGSISYIDNGDRTETWLNLREVVTQECPSETTVLENNTFQDEHISSVSLRTSTLPFDPIKGNIITEMDLIIDGAGERIVIPATVGLGDSSPNDYAESIANYLNSLNLGTTFFASSNNIAHFILFSNPSGFDVDGKVIWKETEQFYQHAATISSAIVRTYEACESIRYDRRFDYNLTGITYNSYTLEVPVKYVEDRPLHDSSTVCCIPIPPTETCPNITVFTYESSTLCIPIGTNSIDVSVNPAFGNNDGYCITWSYALDGVNYVDAPDINGVDYTDVPLTASTRSVPIFRQWIVDILGVEEVFIRATIKECDSFICEWVGDILVLESCGSGRYTSPELLEVPNIVNGISIEMRNPILASQESNITVVNEFQQERTKVWIYDIHGDQVHEFEFKDVITPQLSVVLPQGTYIIKAVNNSGNTAVRKLIVVH